MSFDQIFIFEMRNVLFLRNGKYDEDLTKVIRKGGSAHFNLRWGVVASVEFLARNEPLPTREKERERGIGKRKEKSDPKNSLKRKLRRRSRTHEKKKKRVIFPGCDFEESANYTIYPLQKRPIMDKRERARRDYGHKREERERETRHRRETWKKKENLHTTYIYTYIYIHFLSSSLRPFSFPLDRTANSFRIQRHPPSLLPGRSSATQQTRRPRVRCTRSEGTEEGKSRGQARRLDAHLPPLPSIHLVLPFPHSRPPPPILPSSHP